MRPQICSQFVHPHMQLVTVYASSQLLTVYAFSQLLTGDISPQEACPLNCIQEVSFTQPVCHIVLYSMYIFIADEAVLLRKPLGIIISDILPPAQVYTYFLFLIAYFHISPAHIFLSNHLGEFMFVVVNSACYWMSAVFVFIRNRYSY